MRKSSSKKSRWSALQAATNLPSSDCASSRHSLFISTLTETCLYEPIWICFRRVFQNRVHWIISETTIYHLIWLASPRFAPSFHGMSSACVCGGMNVRPLCRRQGFQRGLDGFRIPNDAQSYIHARAEFKSWPITVGDSPSYFKCILPTSRKRGRSDTSHKKIRKCSAGVKTTPLGRLATISQQGGKLWDAANLRLTRNSAALKQRSFIKK